MTEPVVTWVGHATFLVDLAGLRPVRPVGYLIEARRTPPGSVVGPGRAALGG